LGQIAQAAQQWKQQASNSNAANLAFFTKSGYFGRSIKKLITF